eukprot:178764_1
MAALNSLTSLINTFERNPRSCICGAALIQQIDYRHMYKYPISCDMCSNQIEQSLSWHCPNEFNIIHYEKYHVCNNCMESGTQVTEEQLYQNDLVSTPILESVKIINCSENGNCKILIKFVKIMKQYNNTDDKISIEMDKVQLTQIHDYFLHTLHEHDGKIIFDLLGNCEVTQCSIFKRHYRNRALLQFDKALNVVTGILDKIHCCFQHCYDVGNKLLIDDKKSFMESKDDHRKDKELLHRNQWIVRHSVHVEPSHDFSNITDSLKNKYNMLFTNINDEKTDNKPVTTESEYNFGFQFKYGYDGERPQWGLGAVVEVSPRYTSLKKELIDNDTAALTMEQFLHEMNKASILINSAFCKRHKSLQTHDEEWWWGRKKILHWSFEVEYLMSLMIYCNYSVLQYEFSKTYRNDNGNNHCKFYYWGKCLKISINHFGTQRIDGPVDVFYHGINKQMHFTQYFFDNKFKGIRIHCPLSTSDSLEVAINFAAVGGQIIELCDPEKEAGRSQLQYFSVSWLSDFANEREYLFISDATFQIVNICDIKTGYECKQILSTIRLLHDILRNAYDTPTYVDDSVQMLCQAMLEDSLPHDVLYHKPWKSLWPYAKHIVTIFCKNQCAVDIHYWKIRKYFDFVAKYFVHFDYEWANLQYLNALFPNIKEITVRNVHLSVEIFDDIITSMNNVQLMKVIITDFAEFTGINKNLLIAKYCKIGQQTNVFVYERRRWKQICIEKCNLIKFMVKVITSTNEYIFHNVDFALAEQLIKQKLKMAAPNNTNLQSLFNLESDKINSVTLNMSLNENMYLFEIIGHPNIDGWIKLDLVMKLFPNLNQLKFMGLIVSEFMMDDIYKYLKNGMSGCSKLRILFFEECMPKNTNRKKLSTKYRSQFEAIKWNVRNVDTTEKKQIRFEKALDYKYASNWQFVSALI